MDQLFKLWTIFDARARLFDDGANTRTLERFALGSGGLVECRNSCVAVSGQSTTTHAVLCVPCFFALSANPVKVVVKATGAAHAIEHGHALIKGCALLCIARGRGMTRRWRAARRLCFGAQALRCIALCACLFDLLIPARASRNDFASLNGPSPIRATSIDPGQGSTRLLTEVDPHP